MSLASFICRDDHEREWLLDMNRRLRPESLRAIGVVALLGVVSTPWIDLLSIIPMVGAAAVFGVGMELTQRRQRLEPLVVAWPITQALLALVVAMNGGVHDVGVMLLMFPLVGACGGFPGRLVALSTAYTAALMIVLGLGLYGSDVLRYPPVLFVPVAVLVAVAIISTAVRRSSFEHQTAAVVDQLTGLLNRTALESRTNELAHQSSLTGEPVGLLVADLDHFKDINDRHGHARGDEALVEFAGRLRANLRAFDLAYRLGGEEFVILMPGASIEAATRLAEQIVAAVRREPIAGIAMTLSVGVCASRRGAPFSFDETFAAADAALYEAKRTGRDRVCRTDGPALRPAA